MPLSELAVLLPLPPAAREEPPIHFTLELGRALHRYGTPAHRLEEIMTVVSQQLGLTARFVSTPTALYASFGPPEALRTTIIRLDPGEMNLQRLARVDEIATSVIGGRISLAEGIAQVEALLAAPPEQAPWVTVACYAAASGAGAPLYGGGLKETLVSTVLGLALGMLAVAAARRAALARVFELAGAFLASALAVCGTRLVGAYSTEITTLSALIYLLPGLGLTVAMTELATRHLISGTSRLTGATLVFLQLVFGVALGRRVDLLLPPAPAGVPVVELPPWAVIPALVVLTLALAVLFRARLKADGAAILLAGALAYAGGRVGAHFLGPQLGAFLGAAVLGVASNVFTAVVGRPSLIPLVPGVMLLVPGAIGYRSLESLMSQDVVAGVGGVFSGMVMVVAIVAGILLATALVPPRRLL